MSLLLIQTLSIGSASPMAPATGTRSGVRDQGRGEAGDDANPHVRLGEERNCRVWRATRGISTADRTTTIVGRKARGGSHFVKFGLARPTGGNQADRDRGQVPPQSRRGVLTTNSARPPL